MATSGDFHLAIDTRCGSSRRWRSRGCHVGCTRPAVVARGRGLGVAKARAGLRVPGSPCLMGAGSEARRSQAGGTRRGVLCGRVTGNEIHQRLVLPRTGDVRRPGLVGEVLTPGLCLELRLMGHDRLWCRGWRIADDRVRGGVGRRVGGCVGRGVWGGVRGRIRAWLHHHPGRSRWHEVAHDTSPDQRHCAADRHEKDTHISVDLGHPRWQGSGGKCRHARGPRALAPSSGSRPQRDSRSAPQSQRRGPGQALQVKARGCSPTAKRCRYRRGELRRQSPA